MSLGVIVFAVALTLGATGAFFSDTEKSTGNTFTAGDIDLKIDNESYAIDNTIPDYENPIGKLVASANNSWELKDLTIEKFFDFVDLKPGDYGEDTISVHVGSNDAWLCAAANITSDLDNTITEPEDEVAGANNDSNDGTADGDLDSGLKFMFWKDDGDNVLESDETEHIFINGTLSDMGQSGGIALADSQGGILGAGNPIPGDSTFYIGKAWCYGNLTADPVAQDGLGKTGENGPLDRGTGVACDGSVVGNIGQTDSVVGDLTFYAEQSRNNKNFLCNREVQPETATVNIDKIVTFTETTVIGVDVNDFALHLDGPIPGTGDDQVVIDNIPTTGLPVGQYTISEVYSNDPVGIQFNASFSGSCTEIGDTGVANMTVVPGVNPTCTITNLVVSTP